MKYRNSIVCVVQASLANINMIKTAQAVLFFLPFVYHSRVPLVGPSSNFGWGCWSVNLNISLKSDSIQDQLPHSGELCVHTA